MRFGFALLHTAWCGCDLTPFGLIARRSDGNLIPSAPIYSALNLLATLDR